VCAPLVVVAHLHAFFVVEEVAGGAVEGGFDAEHIGHGLGCFDLDDIANAGAGGFFNDAFENIARGLGLGNGRAGVAALAVGVVNRRGAGSPVVESSRPVAPVLAPGNARSIGVVAGKGCTHFGRLVLGGLTLPTLRSAGTFPYGVGGAGGGLVATAFFFAFGGSGGFGGGSASAASAEHHIARCLLTGLAFLSE